MDDAGLVRRGYGFRELDGDAESLVERQRPPGHRGRGRRGNAPRPRAAPRADQPLLEGLALEILHDEEGDAVLLADVVHGADVRVGQGGDRPGLALEPQASVRLVDGPGGQDLDRDRSLEPPIEGSVDVAHAARPDQGDDLVRPELRSRGEGHCRALRQRSGKLDESSTALVYLDGQQAVIYRGLKLNLGRFGSEPGVRTTVACAGGIPGNSLVEIDCIACI